MKSLYPKNFSRFYDTIYHSQRDGVDNDFFQNEIEKSKGPVLEVGVGTGRLFMQGLDSGVDIYGIDISSEMLEILKKKLKKDQLERISLQNIIDFHFDFQFDLVVAPFRVFMHLLNIEDQLKALENVFNHLKPGGRFIFDVFIPDLNLLLTGIQNHVDFEGEYEQGKVLKRTVTTKPDRINQIINAEFRLEWIEEDGMKSDTSRILLRYFFRYELEHLLVRSPFDSFTIKGDYEGNELNNQSKEFIVYCTKD